MNTHTREEFSAVQRVTPEEQMSMVLASEAKARIEARFIIGQKMPRNEEDSRQRILDRCKDYEFAAEAIYKKPVSNRDIEGLSIRFAEEALVLWKNMDSETVIVSDTEDKRINRVTTIDYQSNSSFTKMFTAYKTVERKKESDRDVIDTRRNSAGKLVYIVLATEDEFNNKEAAQESKIRRNQVIALLPADLKRDALETCKKTVAKKLKADPLTERRKVFDAFKAEGIYASELVKIIPSGNIETIDVSEIEHLRQIYIAIREGHATWASILKEYGKASDDTDDSDGEETKSALSRVTERLKKNQREQQTAPEQTKTVNRITEKQVNRLFAIRKENGITDLVFKDYLKNNYGLTTSKDITVDMYNDICNWCEQAGKTLKTQERKLNQSEINELADSLDEDTSDGLFGEETKDSTYKD